MRFIRSDLNPLKKITGYNGRSNDQCGMPSCCAGVSNSQPAHLHNNREPTTLSEINETTDADLALQTWGKWMFDNRDRGAGVDWYTIQPFERLRQPSAGDPDYYPDMPPLVQAVDEIVRTLPASHRTAAKVWWITFGCTGEQGAANLVGHLLHMRVGRWTFKAMIEFVRGYVAGRLG